MIFVINSGSSSLKFCVFDVLNLNVLADGLAERLSTTSARLTVKIKQGSESQKIQKALGKSTHKNALALIIECLSDFFDIHNIKAVGHRVVHGGEYFNHSVLVDEQVIDKIRDCIQLAPLHNPANLESIEILQSILKVPQIAVFDTAFHQTLPKRSFLYALPYELYKKHHVRRYGFHGISHQYVARACVQKYQMPENDHHIVVAHLGNGCSLCAIKNEQSIDTTMGMTPLEGLVMGTRSGDIDPGIHAYLAQKLELDIEGINTMLNKKSGLLGISEVSNDVRELIAESEKGHGGAKIALDIFCYRVAKSIASLTVSLGRLDALVFTAGIGENSYFVREQVLNQLGFLGLKVNHQANQQAGAHTYGVISETSKDKTFACVIATDEEKMIAKESLNFL